MCSYSVRPIGHQVARQRQCMHYNNHEITTGHRRSAGKCEKIRPINEWSIFWFGFPAGNKITSSGFWSPNSQFTIDPQFLCSTTTADFWHLTFTVWLNNLQFGRDPLWRPEWREVIMRWDNRTIAGHLQMAKIIGDCTTGGKESWRRRTTGRPIFGGQAYSIAVPVIIGCCCDCRTAAAVQI